MQEASIKIGHVVSVAGSRVSAILTHADNGDGNGNGGVDARSAVQVGAIARIPTKHSIVFGMISSLRTENPSFPPVADEKRFFEMELLGEAMVDAAGNETPFQRGVSVYPSLGAQIFAASREDLGRVYARPAASNVRIGTIHQDKTLPAFVTTDHLLGKHFAVLGTSGSGKSCTVALILRAILDQHPNGHIVLLDPHNEYRTAFGERAEVISPANLELPYWLLNFEETVEVLIGRDGMSRELEVGILKGAILEGKRRYVGEGRDTSYITVDTPVPYRLATIIQYLDKQMGRLDKGGEGIAPYMRIKDRIETLNADSRFGFMFSGMFVSDNMAKILSRVLRIPVNDKPITIVDLSGVPSEIVEVVVSMLCRMIFDFALWADRAKSVPVLIVCEEAHRYVPRTEGAFASARKALGRIAKEGRKYGVSLCLVTQRPSELSPDVLSQCNTLFALRMSNQPDQEYVAKALPDSALGLINSLPALRTQEAIVVGEGVNVPVRLNMDQLDEAFRPRSGTAAFSSSWQKEAGGNGFIEETIERWRKQDRG